MKTKVISPDVILKKHNHLVPLKQKFSKSKIREVPGWRTGASISPQSIYITPSKLCKVSSRKEYYSPLMFAIDNHPPYILPKKLKPDTKNKKNLNLKLSPQTQNNSKETKGQVIQNNYKEPLSGKSLPSPIYLKPAFSSENINKFEFDLEKFENRSLSIVLKPKANQFIADKEKAARVLEKRRRSLVEKERNRDFLIIENQSLNHLRGFRRSKSIESRTKSQKLREFSLNISNDCEIKVEDSEIRSEDLSRCISSNSLSLESKHERKSSFKSTTSKITHDRKSSIKSTTSKISKDEFTRSEISSSNYLSARYHPKKSFTKCFEDAGTISRLKRSSTINKEQIPINNNLLARCESDKKHLNSSSRHSVSSNNKEKLYKANSISSNRGTQYKSSSICSNGTGDQLKANAANSNNKGNKLKIINSQDLVQFNDLDFDERQEDLVDPTPQVNIRKFNSGQGFNFSSVSSLNSHSNSKNSGILTPGFSNFGLKHHGHQDLSNTKTASNEPTFSPSINTRLQRSDTMIGLSPKTIKSSLKKSPTIHIEISEEQLSRRRALEKPAKEKASLMPKVSFKGIKNSSSEDEKFKIDPESSQFDSKKNEEEKIDANYLNPKKGKKKDMKIRISSNESMAGQENEKKKKYLKRNSKKFSPVSDDFKRKNKSQNLYQVDSENIEENNKLLNFLEFDYSDFYSSDSSSGPSFPSINRKSFRVNDLKKPNKNKALVKMKKRNLEILKLFKNQAINEQQKKIGKLCLEPVTNFIFNLSFSILKCIKLIRIMEKTQINKTVNREKSFQMLMFDRSSTLEKLQKKKLNENTKIKEKRSLLDSQFSEKKVLKLKKIPSLNYSKSEKPSPRYYKSNKEKTIHLDPKSEQKSEGYSSEPSEQNTRNNCSSPFPSKKSIIKEILRKDLSLQIARQILDVEEDDIQDQFTSSEASDSDQNIQNEIQRLKKKLKNSQNFGFSHEIDFKALKTNQGVFTFSEIEHGCFEVDLENLIRNSAKNMFLENRKKEKEDCNEKPIEIHVSESEGMTEEQMYRARVEKVKVVGEKLKKRREKMKQESDGINSVARGCRKRNKTLVENDNIGDNYEERVYLRLKGSIS